ncbi:YfiR/HmsC family protein [Lacinutrix chionoecetis]
MNFNNKLIFNGISRTITISLVLFFWSLFIFSQNSGNEQVKRLQRAIFVYNFAQQIGWQNQDNTTEFKIGVLGPDRAVIDFKALSQKRKINNKPVAVVQFNAVKDIRDIHLLYVNKNYNFDIDYILNKIEGKNILLVSEDYNFNTSMINIVNVGDSFKYEINTKIIEKENFIVANSLKQYAISSSEKWKNLYKTAEASLNKSKENEILQQLKIKDRDTLISSQKKAISSTKKTLDTVLNSVLIKDDWIKKLSDKTKIQEQKFEDKVRIERALEENIQQQIDFIKSQENKIILSKVEIERQQNFIKNQNIEIEKKQSILDEKKSQLSTQRTVNILLISLISLIVLGALFLYLSYIQKKKLSKSLKNTNTAMQLQAVTLEAKNNELEQFAYIASHDLKEPLITISSLIELLVEEYEKTFDEEGKTTLSYIQESSNRMQKLIDAILQYSRLGKSKNIEAVNCNTIIDTLQHDLKHVIDRTNTKIIVNSLPVVSGAALELRLLFQNLISNGIKFTKKETKPVITIDCNETTDKNLGEYWQFSIKDNGIGIPEKHKERIFSIFQRLHSREEYEGTGIGLAHCKKIVEAHGGRIWLESVEGKGTTFYFTIPA